MREIIRKMLRYQNVSILQVGANDGETADPIHALLIRHKGIHATRVEPLSEPFKKLELNSKRYAASTELFNACVSKHDGILSMRIPSHAENGALNTLHASISKSSKILPRHKEGQVQEVKSVTFETLLNIMKAPKPDIYISDCEGYDIDLIEQLPKDLLGLRVVYIELWDNPQSPEATAKALSRISTVLGRHGFNRIVWDGQDYLSWKSPRFSSSPYAEVLKAE
ncbi:FkbM family methyltransferase [Synechococcus sp. 1G10]|uniref:FkbM family methyltransferase n=1 Tax=Synechococcus sp. 1G10 TaxID=2025605 RepID=UPI00130378D9|nr:FkbM family methyltransferase [Synechococcus sp. 1G10]